MRRWTTFLAVLAGLILGVAARADDMQTPTFAAFAADSRQVAVGWSNGVVARTTVGAAQSTQIGVLPGGGAVRALVWSADGKRVAAATYDSIQVWDVASGAVRMAQKLPKSQEDIWLSADGRRLLARGDDTAWLYDIDSGRQIAELKGGADHAPGIVGDRVLTFADHKVLIWDREGVAVAQVDVSVMKSGVALGTDRLFVSSYDGVRVIDLATGRIVASDKTPGLRRLALLGPDRIVAADDGRWRLYSRLAKPIGADQATTGAAVDELVAIDAGRFAEWRRDGALSVTTLAPEARREVLRLSDLTVLRAASPDGRWAMIQIVGGVANLYDTATGRLGGCISLANDAQVCQAAQAISDFTATRDTATATRVIAALQLKPVTHLDPAAFSLATDSFQYLAATRVLVDQDDLAGARAAYEWLLNSPEPALVAEGRLGLAASLSAEARYPAAIEILQPLVAELRKDPHPDSGTCTLCRALDALSQAQAATGRLDDASASAAEAVASLGRIPDSAVAARTRANYARALEAVGRWIEADALRARQLQAAAEDVSPLEASQAKLAIAESLAARGRGARGDALASEAVFDMARSFDAANPLLLDANERLGRLRLDRLGQPERALEPLRAAAGALAEGGGAASKARLDQFRSVFRAEVAAAWQAGQSKPAQPPAPPAPEVRHRADVRALAASPDGALIASGDRDGLVIVWRVADGTPVAQFKQDGFVEGLRFTADGRALAMATDRARNPSVKAIVPGADLAAPLAAPFTTHGFSGVRLFGKDGKSVGVTREKVIQAAASPDGLNLAYGTSDGEVCIARPGWSRCFKEAKYFVGAVVFDPSGKTLLAAIDGSVTAYNVADLEQVAHLDTPKEPLIRSLAITPDGKTLAIGAPSGEIRIVAWPDGREVARLDGHVGKVQALDFLPDGRLASAGDDGKVVIWDVAQRRAVAAFGVASYGATHGGSVTSVDLSPDGRRVITASEDKTVRIWDAASGVQTQSFRLEDAALRAGFLDARRIAAVGESVSVIDSLTGAPESARRLGSSGPRAVLWTVRGRVAASFVDRRSVEVLGLEPGGHASTLAVGGFKEAALNDDGTRLAVALDGGKAVLWDVAAGHEIASLTSDAAHVAIAGGTVFVQLSPRGLRAFDAATGAARTTAIDPECALDDMLGENGRLVTWGIGGVCVIDEAGHRLTRVGVEAVAAEAARLSPDGRTLAVGSFYGPVLIVDVATSAIRFKLEGHTNQVTSLVFSADGARLVSGSEDHTARVWDVKAGTLIASLGE